ncbi:MAG: efflux RND transporter permease subunit [Spirochaetaceae bacterium]|nr:efflux RND transporter permease subunit [Spirochaetaceae bacterium]
MNISELSVRRPVTITMLYVLACVLALVFIPRLGIALYPSMELPMISVSTSYPNVGPEEIDANVTDVVAGRLNRISGLESYTSSSRNGRSQISLQFGYDTDLEAAKEEVTAALSNISNQLPDGCSSPSIMMFNMDSAPIMQLVMEGDIPIDELKTVAETVVQPMLERVDGVATTSVSGGISRRIVVDLSRNRLEAFGLTSQTIRSALAARNIQVSSGTITHNDKDYEIVTSEYFESLEDIRNTIITTKDGAAIRLDDVADIYEDTTERSVYINGGPGLYISVSNESGTNAASVAKGIHEIMGLINEQLPSGVSLKVMSDDTTLIDSTLNQVYSSAIEGAVLAMLIIFLFLRSFKSSFIIGLSIPISFMLTLMVMSFLDLTVNLMTMSGLILGLGMTVDSSIVILENIQIRRLNGQKSAIAAILGSRNMMTAIFASTATTLCVFIPMLIYEAQLEMFGQMFRDMIITVCVSLVASFVVAVTLVPALCGSILKLNTRTQKPLKNPLLKKIDDGFERVQQKIEDAYALMLEFCLNNKFIVMSLVLVMLVVSVLQFNSMGMNLAPGSSASDYVNVSISMPIGTNNEVVRRYLFEFQDIVMKELDGVYETIILNTGSSNSGSIRINLPDLENQTMSATEVRSALAPYTNQWSDVTINLGGSRGFGGSGGIDVKILSTNTIAAQSVMDEIVALLEGQMPLVKDVSTDMEDGSPRFQISIDTAAAAQAGVSVSSIAQVLQTAITGSTATVFHSEGQEMDIVVQLRESDVQSPSDLGALTVSSSAGLMTLDNFITFQEGRSPRSIREENGERVNHVTASLVEGAIATEVQQQVEELILGNIVLPDSVELEFAGDARDIENFGRVFLVVIGLAIFLVFVVMAAQFESLVDPFIVFFSIPLLLIGVVGIYKITGQTLSLYAYVGIVALVGIVVNNGIVLVDFANQLVREKMPVRKACIIAGRNRLRPILMTTLTTVLGMIPMAFFPGEGAESMQPMCLTLVGGLISGSFMTLFVSPILYSALNKRRERRFDDPDSLMNQMLELDEMEGRKRVAVSTGLKA